MSWEQFNIEMSRWVAPKFVGPEGEGTVYILIHQTTFTGTTIHKWPGIGS